MDNNVTVPINPPPGPDFLPGIVADPDLDILEFISDTDSQATAVDSGSSSSPDGKETGADLDPAALRAASAVERPVPPDQASVSHSYTGTQLDVDQSEAPVPPGKALIPDPTIDPITDCITRVLEIFPDVELNYLTTEVSDAINALGFQGALTHVLHVLCEDLKYPKVAKKVKPTYKRPNDEDDDVQTGNSSKRPKLDYGYGDMSRSFTGGPDYPDLALRCLQEDFRFIPTAHLRETLNSFEGRYAPTYISLQEHYEAVKKSKKRVKLPYKRKKTPFRHIRKGKTKELHDVEFENERKWVLHEVMNDDDELEGGIECGCCFMTYRFHSMIQCPETHLICRNCMKSYASTVLGVHDPKINCIDRSGCTAPILESELRRFLPNGMMKLWERVSQRQEIEAAGIGGLEECPVCDYAVIIENSEDKLLSCGNVEVCGMISCRACKKPNHLPKRCDEVNKFLDGLHVIEEVMTEAYVRNCPHCKKALIKDGGCNTVTCPCGTGICYTCMKPITNHHTGCFPHPGPSVKEARDRAIKEYTRENPDIKAKELEVNLTLP